MRARPILRTLFFIPSILPAVGIFVIIGGLTDPSSGWINRLLQAFNATLDINEVMGLAVETLSGIFRFDATAVLLTPVVLATASATAP